MGQRGKIYPCIVVALAAAVLCIVGPLSVFVGPVPLSAATLVIYLAALLLGPKKAVAACALYLALGMLGLPVFSGFSGGVGKLFGPTGGFLAGYLCLAAVAGWFFSRFHHSRPAGALGMLLGTLLAYALGTAWFLCQTQTTLWAALTVCVFPFLPGDAVKIIIVCVVGPVLRKRLEQANIL